MPHLRISTSYMDKCVFLFHSSYIKSGSVELLPGPPSSTRSETPVLRWLGMFFSTHLKNMLPSHNGKHILKKRGERLKKSVHIRKKNFPPQKKTRPQVGTRKNKASWSENMTWNERAMTSQSNWTTQKLPTYFREGRFLWRQMMAFQMMIPYHRSFLKCGYKSSQVKWLESNTPSQVRQVTPFKKNVKSSKSSQGSRRARTSHARSRHARCWHASMVK